MHVVEHRENQFVMSFLQTTKKKKLKIHKIYKDTGCSGKIKRKFRRF